MFSGNVISASTASVTGSISQILRVLVTQVQQSFFCEYALPPAA